MTYLKGYMKAVKAHLAETNPDRVAAFEKGAATYAKKCVPAPPLHSHELLLTERNGTQGPRQLQRLAVLHRRVDEPGRHGWYVDFPSPSSSRTRETDSSSFPAVLMNYREDGVTPYMVFWKDGVKEVKVVRLALSLSRAQASLSLTAGRPD